MARKSENQNFSNWYRCSRDSECEYLMPNADCSFRFWHFNVGVGETTLLYYLNFMKSFWLFWCRRRSMGKSVFRFRLRSPTVGICGRATCVCLKSDSPFHNSIAKLFSMKTSFCPRNPLARYSKERFQCKIFEEIIILWIDVRDHVGCERYQMKLNENM